MLSAARRACHQLPNSSSTFTSSGSSVSIPLMYRYCHLCGQSRWAVIPLYEIHVRGVSSLTVMLFLSLVSLCETGAHIERSLTNLLVTLAFLSLSLVLSLPYLYIVEREREKTESQEPAA